MGKGIGDVDDHDISFTLILAAENHQTASGRANTIIATFLLDIVVDNTGHGWGDS